MDALIGPYYLGVSITVCIAVLQALGLYIITGLSGQISLGHAAFGLCGAYVAGLLSTRLHWAPWATITTATLAGGLFGIAVAVPSLRVREDFLAIVTLGFGLIVPALLRSSTLLGGTFGISFIEFLGHGSAALTLRLLIALGLVGLVMLCIYHLERSWQGLLWRAIIDDEIAAAASGVPVRQAKVLAFSLGAAISACAGALLVHHIGFASADTYTFNNSIVFLAMVVIGMKNRLLGIVITATLLMLMFEFLRPLESYRMTIYGLLLVVFMHYRQSVFRSLARSK